MSVWAPLQADERKIRQVVLNLLSNAIKFTPEGGGIEVRVEPRDGSVEVSVTDTGIGIAPEDQEAVFEEFRQVGTTDKKVEGTGLGLTLCRKFIELHGGKIWVQSQVGEGSTFTFTIPMRRSESGVALIRDVTSPGVAISPSTSRLPRRWDSRSPRHGFFGRTR
jgi:signal transduction histidine kinase